MRHHHHRHFGRHGGEDRETCEGPESRHPRDPRELFAAAFHRLHAERRAGRHAAHHAFHALRHAMGRHRGGDGSGGHFGEGFGPGGFGNFGGGGGFGGFGDGDGFGRGRKFTSEDLQLMLLVLLADRPSHGYELIKALDARSNGFYSPSPGMVYPALTYLEELGYVSVTLEGNRKRYELSPEGRTHLGENRERADLILAKLTHFGRKMDVMRRALAGEDVSDASGWVRELIEARRALKQALLRRSDVSPEEQRRIAAILARATQEIENGGA
ncbi:PadR family transcriptional regulator [Paraburkholderia sp. J41]|uniref:PadR family transcriptional regulator n=1 Tax=Paraburkholderia sp. J41 TaxID=2805433 RepID=UPI002AC32493|nr:PadR family transcriptional regulator [Paraburkholderia sp. J41]